MISSDKYLDTTGIVDELIRIILDKCNTEDITLLLSLWNETNTALEKFTNLNDKIKDKIKVYLKERKWDRYLDSDSKISVTLSTMKRVTYNNELMKKFLSENELAQITKINTFEKLLILTSEKRKKMNKILRK